MKLALEFSISSVVPDPKHKKEDSKEISAFTAFLETDELNNILKTKGVPSANTAIDKFVNTFNQQIKDHVAKALKAI